MARRSLEGDKKTHTAPEPLVTRHVFLDTQVYRRFGHNKVNPAMKLLKQHVKAHRIVLHTTDITLMEVRRQIREWVSSRQQELAKVEKDINRWRLSAPRSAPSAAVTFDSKSLADELFEQFSSFLANGCAVHAHKALDISPTLIFGRYFAREAPFDGEESKEFPDAFVLQALSAWCDVHGDQMYVVTEDKAMGRAVEADQRLVSIKDAHELLARAAADLGMDGEKAAEEALYKPAFDHSFEVALGEQMGDVVYLYSGDLAEGEAYEGHLISVESITNWSVVGMNSERVSLILDTNAKVSVEVQYEDRSSASYDREDDLWFGAETTSIEIEDEVELEIFVDVERLSGLVRECRVLTTEVGVSEGSDWDDYR